MIMPFLIVGTERYALPIGETPLGGTSEDALPAPELAAVPAAAILTVMPDHVATIRRAAGADILVNGRALDDAPRELAHGARVIVHGIRLLYGDISASGSTADVAGVTDDEFALMAGVVGSEPTADTGGRLIAASDGTVTEIPATGLVIGREPDCDLVLAGRGVSRWHATIRPSLQGYTIIDRSANGVRVNGGRVQGAQVLGRGDVLRFGDEEFRFDADAASFEPDDAVAGAAPVALKPSAVRPPTASSADTPVAPARAAAGADAPAPARTLFATLEVLNEGTLKGTRFRLERPVVHLGRGAHNDVRLTDDSVSGSHATLTRRGGGWVLLDLGATNGTYVEGERIKGEHRLSGVSEIRLGGIKMLFRPIAGAAAEDASTRAVVGVADQAPVKKEK